MRKRPELQDFENPNIFHRDDLLYDDFEKAWEDYADEAEQRIKELEEYKTLTKSHAQKFVDKVDTGRARSRETYQDMKELLKL